MRTAPVRSPARVLAALCIAVSALVLAGCSDDDTPVPASPTATSAATVTATASETPSATAANTATAAVSPPTLSITRTIKASVQAPLASALPERLSVVEFVDERHGWAMRNLDILATDDGGLTWSPRSSLDSAVYALSFVSESTGWAATEKGLRVTRDGGGSWSPVATGEDGRVYAVQFLNESFGWISAPSSERRTLDGGRSWERVVAPCPDLRGKTGGEFALVAPDRAYYVCAGGPATIMQAKGFYATTDGGKTWGLIAQAQPTRHPSNGVPNTMPITGHLGHLDCSGDRCWMSLGRLGLVATDDGGLTWRVAIYTDDIGWTMGVRHFSPEVGLTVVGVSGASALLRTTDSGRHWTPLNQRLLSPAHSLSFAQDGAAFGAGLSYVGGLSHVADPRAVLRSQDGVTWSANGYVPEEIDALAFIDSIHGLALTHDEENDEAPTSIYRTANGGANWEKVGSVAGLGLTSLVFVDENVGYARAKNEVFRTDDGGRTWSPTSWGEANDIAASAGDIWRITKWRLYHSADGTTWDEPSPALRARAVSPAGHALWVVPIVKAVGLLRSDDGGRTWVRIDLGGIKLAEVAARDANSAIVRTSTDTLLVTSDGGATWSTLPAPASDVG